MAQPTLWAANSGQGAKPEGQPLPASVRWWQFANVSAAPIELFVDSGNGLLQIETIPANTPGLLHPAPDGDVRVGLTSVGAVGPIVAKAAILLAR